MKNIKTIEYFNDGWLLIWIVLLLILSYLIIFELSLGTYKNYKLTSLMTKQMDLRVECEEVLRNTEEWNPPCVAEYREAREKTNRYAEKLRGEK